MKRLLLFIFSLLLLLSVLPSGMRAQWKRVTTLPAADASNYWLDVFFLPSNPQYGWICGFNRKVIRTTDGGNTWSGSSVPGSISAIDHLESIHFVDTQNGYTSGPAGIFKSTNGGVTWTNVTPTTATIGLWGCYFINANEGVVIAEGCGGDQQFYRTTNGGADWTLFHGSEPNSGLSDAIIDAFTGTGYAVSSGRLWRTPDFGQTWQLFSTIGPKYWSEEITKLNSSFLVPWAGNSCVGGNGSGGMLFSVDGGQNWNTYPLQTAMFGTFLLTPTAGWACGDAQAVYYTSNGGASWQLRNCGINSGDLDDIWFVNDSLGWVVGSGVYKYQWPPYEVNRDTVKFGEVCIPGTKLDTVWVINKSGSQVSANVTLGGTHPSQFAVVAPSSGTVPTCDSLRIIVRFQPTSAGVKTAVATVTIANRTVSFVLTGSGRNSATVPADTLVTMNPAPVGKTTFGSLNWSNTGLLDETLTAQRINGDPLITVLQTSAVVSAGSFSTITFSVIPQDTGWTLAQYRFRLLPCNRDTMVLVRVYGVSPIINASDSMYSELICAKEKVVAVPCRNTGNDTLAIASYALSGVNAGDFTILNWKGSGGMPHRINPGTSDTLFIRFRPSSQGSKQALLKLVNNDSTGHSIRNPKNIILSAVQSTPKFTLSNLGHDFGELCVGDARERTVIVRGDVLVSAEIDDWGLKDGKKSFVILSPVVPPQILKSKDSIVFALRFTPDGSALYADTLRIHIGGTCDTTFLIPLVGKGKRALSAPKDTLIVINPLPTDKPHYDTMNIYNSSSQKEDIAQIESIPGVGFTVLKEKYSFPIALAPTKIFSIPLVTSVPDTGWFTTRYRVKLQFAPCQRDTFVTVRAYGVSPVLTAPASIQFNHECDNEKPDTLRVVNSGNLDLQIQAPFTFDGPGKDNFVVNGWTNGKQLGESFVIPPGDSVGLVIQFKPANPGNYKAEITFHHNDFRSAGKLNGFFKIQLTGIWAFAKLSASVPLISFDSVCVGSSSAVFDVAITNIGNIVAQVSDILVHSPDFTIDNPGAVTVLVGKSVIVHIRFTPKQGGLIHDSLVFRLLCSSVTGVQLEGFGKLAQITATPNPLNGGELHVGDIYRDTVRLRSTGNVPATITDITLSPARTDWKIIPPLVAGGWTLPPGKDTIVVVEFMPVENTLYSGQLCVKGEQNCPFTTCVPVDAVSTSSDLLLSKTVLDFGEEHCSPSVRIETLIVKNIGKASLVITNLSLQKGLFVIKIPSIPSIAIGESAEIIIEWNPTAEGVFVDTLIITTTDEIKKIPVTATYRTTKTTAQKKSANFGTHVKCDSEQSIDITLNNDGLLPDTLLVVRAIGQNEFVTDPGDTVFVLPQQQMVWTVKTLPASFKGPGVYKEKFLLISLVCGDTILIDGSIVLSSLEVTAQPSPLDFNSVHMGEDRFDTVRVLALEADRPVTDIFIMPPNAGFSTSAKVPFTLETGKPYSIPVHFTPQSKGDALAVLYIAHGGPCFDTVAVPLKASVPDEVYRITVHLDRYTAMPGDTLFIPLRFTGPLRKIAIDSVVTHIRFDKWLMEPLAVSVGSGAQSVTIPFNSTFPDDMITVTIPASTLLAVGADFAADGTVFTMKGLALASIPDTTTLFIQDCNITPTDPSVVMTVDKEHGFLQSTSYCSVITRGMRFLSKFDAHTIAPNPVADQLVLMGSSTGPQTLWLEVYDAFGRKYPFPSHTNVVEGENTLLLDVGSLPAGVYFLQIKYEAGAENKQFSVFR